MDIHKDEEIIPTINIENDEVRKDNIEKPFLFIILYDKIIINFTVIKVIFIFMIINLL